MPDNVRRGQPQGKCHRKQTARSQDRVRVKGWGKSPPRLWKQRRHGKPHREQNRIGMTRNAQALQPVSGPVIRVGCKRRRASAVPDEWLPRSGLGRSHTEPGLQANWQIIAPFFGWAFSLSANNFEGRRTPRFPGVSGHRGRAFSLVKTIRFGAPAEGDPNLSLNLTAYEYSGCGRARCGFIPLTPIWSHGIPKQHCKRANQSPIIAKP